MTLYMRELPKPINANERGHEQVYFASVSKTEKLALIQVYFFVTLSTDANRTMKVTPVGSQRHHDMIDKIL